MDAEIAENCKESLWVGLQAHKSGVYAFTSWSRVHSAIIRPRCGLLRDQVSEIIFRRKVISDTFREQTEHSGRRCISCRSAVVQVAETILEHELVSETIFQKKCL